MHTGLDAQLYITILLYTGRAEELVLGALVPFAGALLSHQYAPLKRETVQTRELTLV